MQPEAPQDVRIVHEDGSSTACEVVYVGDDEEGIHQWLVTAAVPTMEGLVVGVFGGKMPPRTRLLFRALDEEEGS
jgi:hypothetical protein